jgi:hypothetical protein
MLATSWTDWPTSRLPREDIRPAVPSAEETTRVIGEEVTLNPLESCTEAVTAYVPAAAGKHSVGVKVFWERHPAGSPCQA